MVTAVAITHSTVVTGADDPSAEVNKDEWNDDHVITSVGDATKYADGTGQWSVPGVGGQKFQSFSVQIANVAGTLKHKICESADAATAATYGDKVSGASTIAQNTPTVSNIVDFTTGVGINSNAVVLNTAAQTLGTLFGFCVVEWYDGNVAVLPRVRAELRSRNVNGTTRTRLEFIVSNQGDGGTWTINTTNIPSGKTINFKFVGALA